MVKGSLRKKHFPEEWVVMVILSYMSREAVRLDYHYRKIIGPHTRFSVLTPPKYSQFLFPLEEGLMILLFLAA